MKKHNEAKTSLVNFHNLMFLFFVNIIAFWTISTCLNSNNHVLLESRSAKIFAMLKNLKVEMERHIKRKRESLYTNYQKEYINEDRQKILTGTSTSLQDSADSKPLKIQIHERCHSGILAARNNKRPENIWIYEFEYPTHEPETCLTFKYKDHKDKAYEANFQEGCNEIYHMLMRWMSSSRISMTPVETANIPVSTEGAQMYGLAFMVPNPSAAYMWFWNTPSNILSPVKEYALASWTHEENPDDNSKYDFIKGQVLDDDFKLHDFVFDKWLKRNRLTIKELKKFLENQSRSFPIQRIVPIEGKENQFENPKDGLYMEEILDFLVEKGKPKSITIGSHSFETAEMENSDIEFKWNPRENVCMELTVKAATGIDHYFAEENCNLIYLEFERFQRSS